MERAHTVNTSLTVVAKHPEVGTVKTRLARIVGHRAAYELYSAFLRDIVARFRTLDHDFCLAYTPPDAPFDGFGARTMPQLGATLGERLHAIFRLHAGRFPGGTLVVSSDSPHVPVAWIDEAFARMADHDLVLGPCDDGGYWCVGMRGAHDVFTGVPMSTPVVLERTVALARAHDLRVHLLPQTFDVDEAADVARLVEELDRDGAADLPHTRQALEDFPELTIGEARAAALDERR